MTTTLPAGTTAYRFRYWTESFCPRFAPTPSGCAPQPIDRVTEASGWTLDGFRLVTDGSYTITSFHYYVPSPAATSTRTGRSMAPTRRSAV